MNSFKILILLIICICLICIYINYNSENQLKVLQFITPETQVKQFSLDVLLGKNMVQNSDKQDKVSLNNDTKYILYWNEAYGSSEYGFCCGQKPYFEFSCPEKNCYVTNNRTYLKNIQDYDAILFHQRTTTDTDLPVSRSPKQRYIMFMMESASYPMGFSSSKWNNFFNW